MTLSGFRLTAQADPGAVVPVGEVRQDLRIGGCGDGRGLECAQGDVQQ